jgi:hypothetical protein
MSETGHKPTFEGILIFELRYDTNMKMLFLQLRYAYGQA